MVLLRRITEAEKRLPSKVIRYAMEHELKITNDLMSKLEHRIEESTVTLFDAMNEHKQKIESFESDMIIYSSKMQPLKDF